MDAIICDTSSLVRLFKIDGLGLIGIDFDHIYIPREVYEECHPPLRAKLDDLRFEKIEGTREQIEKYGKGERAMLNIALERHIGNVLTDDTKAIREAERQGLTVYTTLDIIVGAKYAGVITSVREKLDLLKRSGEFITIETERQALEKAGETTPSSAPPASTKRDAEIEALKQAREASKTRDTDRDR
jgi:predicted nucleic acid-binding protein